MTLTERNHNCSELLRFRIVDGADVLSDGQIHNLYYGLMSEVIDEQSPSFSPETQPIEIAPASPDLFDTSSSSELDIPDPLVRSNTTATTDLLNLVAAAERAATATEEIAPGASNALSELAMAASVLVRSPNNSSPTSSGHGASTSSGHGASASSGYGANTSSGYGANTSSGYGANTSSRHDASASSSPYYGEAPTCVVCMDEMVAPGVTDGACDHRSTCTPCLRRILFNARGEHLVLYAVSPIIEFFNKVLSRTNLLTN